MSVSTDAQVDVSACLDAVIQAFKDGGAIIEKIKKKRALKRAPPPPRLLEESIDQAPAEIEREKKRGVNRFGKAFEDGDTIAIIALQHITIQLQASLLEKLRNAAFDSDSEITDFTYLTDAADTGRDRTIAALHEFKQRLINSHNVEQEREPQQEPQQAQPRSTPNSSTSNIITPPSEPTRSQTMQMQQSHSQEKQQMPAKHRTWTRDYGPPHEEDTTPGASEAEGKESHASHHRKRSSILHFLKHTRTHSSEKDVKDKALPPPVEEPHGRHASAATTVVPYRATPSKDTSSVDLRNPNQSQSNFRYEDWEDNPEEIWGEKPHVNRRDTSVAPDQAQNPNASSAHVHNPLQPPSPVLTHRSNSNPHVQTVHASVVIPTPNPENDFLGYCKGAWKLQNGDRKGSMHKCRDVEPWSRHPSAHAASNSYLACQQPRCAFRSSFSNANVDFIWSKVFTIEPKGIKLRWTFLAKSHVTQKVVVKHQYSFKCLFCVFLGGNSGVYHGMDYYLDHITSEHRGANLGEVVLYKAGCINDRIANDDEEFDINLFPATGAGAGAADRKESYLNDDLMNPYWKDDDKNDSMFGANEPWNEGLSDFHYGGDFDGNELE